MRAIRINPYDSTVTECATSGRIVSEDGLPSLYTALSDPAHAVDLFTVIDVDGGGTEMLYLDDEGLLQPGRACWRLKDYPTPLCGVGLILGTDSEGEACSSALTLDYVRSLVTWTDEESTGEIGPGREMSPAEARAASHGFATGGWVGGAPILQPRGTWAAHTALKGQLGNTENLGD